jgi:hypothetical protein
MDWMTLTDLAAHIGCSRRTVERALDADGVVGAHRLESRAVTAADLAAGVHPKTSRLARVARQDATDIASRVDDAMSEHGSAEDTLEWLERIRAGEETCTVFTAKGEKFDDEPWPHAARSQAGKEAQRLREFLDERERAYIPRDIVSDALVSLAALLAARLSALPPRMADRLVGAETVSQMRERLKEAIDEVRAELGDEAERRLTEVLGTR